MNCIKLNITETGRKCVDWIIPTYDRIQGLVLWMWQWTLEQINSDSCLTSWGTTTL